MKKTLVALFLLSVFAFSFSPVLAEENTTGSNSPLNTENIKEKVRVALERKPESTGTKSANADERKAQGLTKVRAAIVARWNAYDRLVNVAGQLLDKLQIRINNAKAAGKNTAMAEAAMTDARAKLADARAKLDGIKASSGTTTDKNTFLNLQKSLQAVHKDLNIVKQDAAKIISTLRSFNASTKSAEMRSTSSAKER